MFKNRESRKNDKKDKEGLSNSIQDAIFLLEKYRDFASMQIFQTSFSLYH